MQCVGTPVCTQDANNRDVEWTLKQWLRFLYTKMVEGIRGNIGGGNSYNCNNIGGGNSYNYNTFSLRKNWYNTDTTSRHGVNIILHTSLQAYKKCICILYHLLLYLVTAREQCTLQTSIQCVFIFFNSNKKMFLSILIQFRIDPKSDYITLQT